jgi:hypothetical protein
MRRRRGGESGDLPACAGGSATIDEGRDAGVLDESGREGGGIHASGSIGMKEMKDKQMRSREGRKTRAGGQHHNENELAGDKDVGRCAKRKG